jgi:hypothetical protein
LELGRLEKARTLIAQNGLLLVKKAQKLRGYYTLRKKVKKEIFCYRFFSALLVCAGIRGLINLKFSRLPSQ